MLKIYRPRPGLPFTKMRLDDGAERLLWTTFTSEQIDIDVRSSAGRAYLDQILREFQAAGIRAIRLDAAGYAIKKPGTRCFMIPETFDFIADLTAQAHARGIEVLVEIHAHYQDQIDIAKQVDWVYDFALPPLVLQALFTRNAVRLKQWLTISPRNCITVLDTHDGIGVIDVGPDRHERRHSSGIVDFGGDRQPGRDDSCPKQGREPPGDREQPRTTWTCIKSTAPTMTLWDGSDEEYLIARALQFFAPGIPQVYYVGLLAGVNDWTCCAEPVWAATSTATTTAAGRSTPNSRVPVVAGAFRA